MTFRKTDDEALVARMDNLGDPSIVQLLKDGNDDAWRYVLLRAVAPVLKSPQIGRIAYDRHLSDIDVLGMVFEYLVAKKAIDQFEFRCPLIYWIRFWTSKSVMEYCRKNPNPVSDEAYLAVLSEKAAKEYDREGFEIAEACFKRLWKENRLRACVHYLKVFGELSSREIMKLLHLSSEANVNQIFSRACKDMRMYRDALERPTQTLNARKEVADELS